MLKMTRYYFETKKVLFIFLVLMGVGFMLLPYTSISQAALTSIIRSSYIAGTIYSICLSYIIPFYLFYFVHNRKAVDNYFALPISRFKLGYSTLITACLLVVLPILPMAVINLFIAFSAHIGVLNYLIIILVSIPVLVALTLINTALYLIGNNLFDGVVMVLAYTVAPWLFCMILQYFFLYFVAGAAYRTSVLINIFTWLCPTYDAINIIFSLLSSTDLDFGCYLVYIILTLISLLLFNTSFVSRKVERAEQVSDSFYAYPFIIRLYVVSVAMIISFGFINSFLNGEYFYFSILLLMLFAAFIIANFVYRREIHIERRDIIYFVSTILLSILLSLFAYNTKGFGLAYAYDHNPGNIIYYYNGSAPQEVIDLVKEESNTTDDDYDYANVYFDLIIDDNSEQYNQVIEIMENLRNKKIIAFYENQTNSGYSYLRIVENYIRTKQDGDFVSAEEYTYYNGESLNYDELRKLSEYCSIYLSSASDTIEINSLFK